MKLRIETESHLVFVRKSWDYSRRPIYGGFPRTKFVMVGLVVFKLQLFELFCCLLLKVFSCSQNISFWRYNSQNLGEHRSDPHLPKGTTLSGMTIFSRFWFRPDMSCVSIV